MSHSCRGLRRQGHGSGKPRYHFSPVISVQLSGHEAVTSVAGLLAGGQNACNKSVKARRLGQLGQQHDNAWTTLIDKLIS